MIGSEVGKGGEDQGEMGSLLMNIPRQKNELPPHTTTNNNQRGEKLGVPLTKDEKTSAKKEKKKDAISDSESEIDLNKVPSFGADFQEILQDTLDKKLPSFCRRKTSVQRDEKRVEELVVKGQTRANTNRETVINLLEEKEKERKEVLENARKQLKKEGKLVKESAKEKEKSKDRANLNLDLNVGKEKSKKNKEGHEDGKGTKERKRKKTKDGEAEGQNPKKDEKKGTLEKEKRTKKHKEKKDKQEAGKGEGPDKKNKDKSVKKEAVPEANNTPIYAQVDKNKNAEV